MKPSFSRVLLVASVAVPIVALVAILGRTPPRRPSARRPASVAIGPLQPPIRIEDVVAKAEAAVEATHDGAQVWLGWLDVAALDVDGVVHLARGPVELAFMVRSAHSTGYCYQLRLDGSGWTEDHGDEVACEAGVSMRCSIDELWRRAIAAGASRDGLARVRLYARRSDETHEGAELWGFSMSGGTELTLPDDCAAPTP